MLSLEGKKPQEANPRLHKGPEATLLPGEGRPTRRVDEPHLPARTGAFLQAPATQRLHDAHPQEGRSRAVVVCLSCVISRAWYWVGAKLAERLTP